MLNVGYQWLCDHYDLKVFPLRQPALVGPVSRVMADGDALRVPVHVAPSTENPLEHFLFALKHEGINLQVLYQGLRKLPTASMLAAVQAQPSSRYVRVLGFLWESFNHQLLSHTLQIAGPTVMVLDPKRYITGADQRNARWRVNFNGLGSLDYCVTVERTAEIEAYLQQNLLQQANVFIQGLNTRFLDHALSWAYLHETESSFAIEHEVLAPNKTEAFTELLRQAHQPHELDEAYLVALQNLCITNPLDKAVFYRHQQNWLRGPLRGASGVTYIPPMPTQVRELMHQLLSLAKQWPKQIDPLIAASVLSFAFVFIHPFMDGNGRLSRFLFHSILAQSGVLPPGVLLPVSVAMKRNEDKYLQALQSFSAPMRKHWQVQWLGDEDYEFCLKADESLYRYWDATECVAFGLAMTQQALEHDLHAETQFLQRFDQVYRAINERFDVRGKDLTTLVLNALQNNGKVSNNRRKQFLLTVQEHIFDAIEQACEENLSLS